MMQKFEFHWIDGSKELGIGTDVADAFTRLGYGHGAIGALDYYEAECEPLPD